MSIIVRNKRNFIGGVYTGGMGREMLRKPGVWSRRAKWGVGGVESHGRAVGEVGLLGGFHGVPFFERDHGFSGLRAFVFADDSGGGHLLDQTAGPAVADCQAALQQRHAAALGFEHHTYGVIEEFIFFHRAVGVDGGLDLDQLGLVLG